MDRNELAPPKPSLFAALAALAALTSAVIAVAVLYAVRRGRGAVSGNGLQQPTVRALTPAEIPQHFSEDLIVPGFTETGAEVEEQDAELGRSPEGV